LVVLLFSTATIKPHNPSSPSRLYTRSLRGIPLSAYLVPSWRVSFVVIGCLKASTTILIYHHPCFESLFLIFFPFVLKVVRPMIKQKFKDKHMSETMCVDKSNLLYEAGSLMNFLPVSASSYVFGCQFFIISFWCCCHWWKNWYICHEWWSCDYKLTTTAFLLRPCFYMICIRSWSPNLFIVCVLDLF